MEYLVGGALSLHDLAIESAEGHHTIKPAEAAAALGFVTPGAGTVFPKQDDWRWLRWAMDVQEAIAAGDKEYIAIENAAEEYSVSKSNVRRAWKRLHVTDDT